MRICSGEGLAGHAVKDGRSLACPFVRRVAGALVSGSAGLGLALLLAAGPALAKGPLRTGASVQSSEGSIDAPLGTSEQGQKLSNDETANILQDLHAEFTPRGLRLTHSSVPGAFWDARLTPMASGSLGRVQPLAPARQASSGGRIAYFYGAVNAWYVSRENGLEQGFLVSDLPAAEGRAADERPGAEVDAGTESFEIDIALAGDLKPNLTQDGQNLDLYFHGNKVLRYGIRRALDAAGLEIAARLEISASATAGEFTLRVIMDPGGHAFPLAVSLLIESDRPRDPADEAGATGETGSASEASAAGRIAGEDLTTEEGHAFGPSTAGRLLVAPANDQCAGAEVIPNAGPGPYLSAVTPDITNATTTGDPTPPVGCPAGSADPSRGIWYRFAPAVSGVHTISVCADAPTGTNVDDTILGVFTSSNGACDGALTPVGCDDDSCVTEFFQSIATTNLTVGTTYFILVWKWDDTLPAAGNTAVQVRVAAPSSGPSNDVCGQVPSLTLDLPMGGTNSNAHNDYQLSGGACYFGEGQNPSFAGGRETGYSFTAPTADEYSFRAQNQATGGNLVLYVAGDCPAATPGLAVIVGSCLGASNRNVNIAAYSASEDVACLPLAAGQQVFVFVDEAALTTSGGTFRLEVNRCPSETEPNDAPESANVLECGIEGASDSVGDADFFSLGTPVTGSRLFAIADGVSANSTDFDLRVTTATDTLEYDDLNNDVPFGSVGPNVAGTKTTGSATFLRLSQFNSVTLSEPYRLYAVVQPPSGAAAAEVEPNGTTAQAQNNASPTDYFYGTLPGPAPSTDIDLYPFSAAAGDLIVLGLDQDPGYDRTVVNAALGLLGPSGTVLLSVNDASTTTSFRAPVPNNLLATSPVAPAEGLTYRVTTAGTYHARVTIGTTSTGATGAGDYLLSISKNCSVGGGGLSADLSLTQSDSPDPVFAGQTVTYVLRVANAGPADALGVVVVDSLSPGISLISTAGCTEDPAGAPACTLGTIAAGTSKQFTLAARVAWCIGNGTTLTSNSSAASVTSDPHTSNNSASQSTTVSDPRTCDDGDPCTLGDHCAGAACAPASTITAPPEATGLMLGPNKQSILWVPTPSATEHDILRGALSGLPVGPGGGDELCMMKACGSDAATPASCKSQREGHVCGQGMTCKSVSGSGGTCACQVGGAIKDPAVPAPSSGLWYLVRGANVCGHGVYGFQWTDGRQGLERQSATCP